MISISSDCERKGTVSVNSQERALPEPKPRMSLPRRWAGLVAPLTFLFLLVLALSALTPHFLERDNLTKIIIQAAVVAILATGQTAVIISGNIDLSVGAVMALSGVTCAVAMAQHGASVWAAVAIALLVGLVAGTVTGVITAFGKIPSFIVTLGTMGIFYGLAGIASGSNNVGGLPQGFFVFGDGELFGSATRDGLPYPILIMIAVAVAAHVLLSRTRWGRALYAMGGNLEATRLSGIRLPRMIISVFALSGLLAGIAAVISVSRSHLADQNAGTGYELYAVAATVIGGTSLFGGQGGVAGTIIGALLMFTIRNGCALMNLNPEYQRVVIGVVVILAVLYDRFGPGKARAAAR